MQLYSLDEASAEVIFAPFHDPLLSQDLPVKLRVVGATGCRIQNMWDASHIFWESCPSGEVACFLTLQVRFDALDFDQFVFCVTYGDGIQLSFEACTDGAWSKLSDPIVGHSSRQEITLGIPRGNITSLRMLCTSLDGRPSIIRIHWFGLSNSKLVEAIQARCKSLRIRDWTGLLDSNRLEQEPCFKLGLLFDDSELDRLRLKKSLPYWSAHFDELQRQALTYCQRSPELDLGEYLPWSDERYIRTREHHRQAYFWQPLALGLVGLVNRNPMMIKHALRYLFCIVHTTHWCQSAESRACGSTWNQRCFLEEMACTTVAILSDWFDYLLTDQAKAVVYQSLWEKGLAIIERDMMKHDEVHHINQGVWFCRARILAGLILESSWPHMGNYVDRASEDLRSTLSEYIKEDGGTEEGMGYFCLTVSMALQSLIAYSRVRHLNLQSLLPEQFDRCESFFAAMSAVEPGRLLLNGDNSTNRVMFDLVPILARLYPSSGYANVLAPCLLPDDREFTYFDHYDPRGVFGFIFGPTDVSHPKCIVPECARFPMVGQLTSLRDEQGRSIRIHVSGTNAHPSHSHFDRGSFTIELDGQPVLIDRGITRYDHPSCFSLKRTSLHNAITPISVDGEYPDQLDCTEPVIPDGDGNRIHFHAKIDISHAWRDFMKTCCRSIDSPDRDVVVIRDEGTLIRSGRIAFHLHSPWPFQVRKDSIVVGRGRQKLSIDADWSENVLHYRDLIDYAFCPVYHLVIISRPVSEFALKTRLSRI